MPSLELDPGQLTKRISIFAANTTPNQINEPSVAGALVVKVWADLNPPRTGGGASEIMRAGGDAAEARDYFLARYNALIDETREIEWNNQRWRIEAIETLGAKTAMGIWATRVQ